jgi:predicted TPR repeat methyltransferase
MRGLYSELTVGDIEALDRQSAYDLVIGADTLVYLGDLAPLFASVRNALRPSGLVLFTAERSDGGEFALGSKRRWRHSEGYLRRTAQACGLEVNGVLACSPRSEAGAPVEGLAVALQKPF